MTALFKAAAVAVDRCYCGVRTCCGHGDNSHITSTFFSVSVNGKRKKVRWWE